MRQQEALKVLVSHQNALKDFGVKYSDTVWFGSKG